MLGCRLHVYETFVESLGLRVAERTVWQLSGPFHSVARTFCEHAMYTGRLGKLKSEAIRIFCSLTPITRMFQSSGMRWARYVMRTGARLYAELRSEHWRQWITYRTVDGRKLVFLLLNISALNYNNT